MRLLSVTYLLVFLIGLRGNHETLEVQLESRGHMDVIVVALN